MLKYSLIQPDILRALGAAGHGARVLITDGNYPASTACPPSAAHVYLNLAPGLVNATDVLKALISAIPIEAAHVMQTADGSEPPIFDEFRKLLGPEIPLQLIDRFGFYETSAESNTCLVIATGEQRIYANLLLTIGVVMPG